MSNLQSFLLYQFFMLPVRKCALLLCILWMHCENFKETLYGSNFKIRQVQKVLEVFSVLFTNKFISLMRQNVNNKKQVGMIWSGVFASHVLRLELSANINIRANSVQICKILEISHLSTMCVFELSLNNNWLQGSN